MIRHIVLFKFKEFQQESAKKEKLTEIKNGLENLIEIISELKHIHVGINMNANETFDLALTTEFESMKDLDIYANHPDHQLISKKIREHLDSRACVDYEF